MESGTQAWLDNLREEVSCPICSEIFTDPRHLSCLHSFCLHCLKRWHQTNQSTTNRQDVITCPTCQALSSVPRSCDLNDLPTSSYQNGLIDVLAIKECNNTQVTCGNCCEKSSEASYCFECCIFYCEECVTAHRKMRSSKNHRALALKEFNDKDYEDVLKRPAFCPKQRHQNEELKYYCKNCKLAICQTCINLEHSGHALENIEDEAERQKTVIRTVMETQRQNLQAKKNIVSQLEETCVKVLQKSEEMKTNIQLFVEKLKAAIDRKQECLFAAVEKQTEQSLEMLTKESTKIADAIKATESSLEKADDLFNRGINAEIIQLKNSLETISQCFVQSESDFPDHESFESLVFVENKNLLDTVNSEEIGFLKIPQQTKVSQSIIEGKGLNETFAGRETEFTLTTKTAEGRQCYHKRDHVTVEIRDKRGREYGTEVQISDSKNGQYKISYSLKEQGRYSIIIKVNGEHVRDSPNSLLVKAREQAISSGSHSPCPSVSRSFSLEQGACSQVLLVKPFQFKPVLSFGKFGSSVRMFRGPWGVAVSDKDEIAVTDRANNRVQIFDSGGNYLRSFGRHGTNQGELNYPSGICFDDKRNILVVDHDNHRIQIFSRTGKYMGMFVGKGSLDSHFYWPWGLSLDSNGNIIVADSGNKLIKIFSTDGKFVRKIGGPGSFSLPVHCVQCDEYLIVSDNDEHCIKVFSTEGKFQYKFGLKGGGDGEFNYPRCMAVTQSKHLMVCDQNNNRIQVFELNGKFVAKFGTTGSNLGEFNRPTSVAALSNGRIVLSDNNNHRVQILE